MFRGKTLTTDELQTMQYYRLEKTLAVLQNHWPALYADVIEACRRRYEPDRIGAILVTQIELIIETVKKEYETKIDRMYQDRRAKLDELQEELKILKKEKTEAARKMNLLLLSNEELQRKMDAQNDLVANQYEQIQALTGSTSSE